jgi:pyrroloquinoline quinone biosynthesis protein E
LTFWNVREHALADIWDNSPAFLAFRGTDWMQEPCRSCPKAKEDFGGCRCQAFALTGDARAADPVCHLSPHHARVAELAELRADAAYEYRR